VTVPDLLLDLLRRAEADLPGVEILTADEVSPWPAGALEALVQNGFLSPTTPGTSVLCDACLEDHWQDVEFVESPPGTRRAYIVCPEAGRVAVDTTRLKRWRVDVARLAGALGQLLGCTQAPDELVASRLWRLGRTKLAGESRDAFLVRGLTWPNAAEALGLQQRLRRGVSSLLLALVEIVADPPAGTSVVPLTRALSLADNRLYLDLPYIESVLVSDADRSLGKRNTFRKQGEYWAIRYEGPQFNLPNLKGLRYIACLLASPGREFGVLELVSRVEGQPPRTALRRVALPETGLRVKGSQEEDDLLDDEARGEYRGRLAELARKKSLSGSELEEKRWLESELRAATGLGGRPRKVASDEEKARVNVTNLVRSAIGRIGQHDAALAIFLGNSIKTGLRCSYIPDKPITWIVSS
jgi:hypothetical protein